MGTMHCPGCGVVVPEKLGRCPSCRAWLGHRLIAIGLAGALMAVGCAWALIQMRGPGQPAAPRLSVQITPGVPHLAPNASGTDTSATIDNPNPMPVDVTIRVRGFDITDRSVIEDTIGPFRNVPAGGFLPIQAYLDATPLKAVTFEAIAVKPVKSDRPDAPRSAGPSPAGPRRRPLGEM
jgi:hypothetical protein